MQRISWQGTLLGGDSVLSVTSSTPERPLLSIGGVRGGQTEDLLSEDEAPKNYLVGSSKVTNESS